MSQYISTSSYLGIGSTIKNFTPNVTGGEELANILDWLLQSIAAVDQCTVRPSSPDWQSKGSWFKQCSVNPMLWHVGSKCCCVELTCAFVYKQLWIEEPGKSYHGGKWKYKSAQQLASVGVH